ncbi:hypothetical protein NE172_13875 [Clostridium botulinum]|uniref:DUF1795 domain-containing protein n=1 Tax=Clostridium botulinum TaxID=1491 RepID=A0A6B4JLB3_CLOBO|nr:hypothetical protein [Clostridium botulinum]EES50283.1 conserved hypothetical protein [Clostridium botulinum E1 str. 'BoNT E Beluga']MBY6761123.1 hypothetical protein [Clostridium botulinum]MBY6921399.1 hypothetical protein [Clostridium botulinum]MCR1132027.1 hypothetical protein [Clostridium botulinum]NFE95152.1 hypothetical protein [Clostridium botulinum]
MDERVDEKILDFINAAEEKELRKNITNGLVKINNKFYEFEETEFFDGALKMYIPNTFEDMSMEARKLKYPSESRPEIIKSNDDGSICITLNVINSKLDEEHVEEVKDLMKGFIKKTNPSNIFYKDGLLEVNSKNVGFFEFKSYAVDDSLYNISFFLEFEGKTFMGTFSCPYNECKEWRDVAFQFIRTIKVESK